MDNCITWIYLALLDFRPVGKTESTLKVNTKCQNVGKNNFQHGIKLWIATIFEFGQFERLQVL